MSKSVVLLLPLISIWSLQAHGAVQTKTITYSDGDVQLEGHLAWDDSIDGKRPGVLVVHEWWGLNDYARRRAEQLAEMGYVAFALDMYGKGKVTQHPKQAGEWAGMIRKNADAWRKRAVAGLSILKQQEMVDSGKLAAIGYCFGGSTVLQLAYAGSDIDGVVSFHGSLPAPSAEEAKNIQAQILVCHGAADGFVPAEQISAFQKALDEAEADWHMVYYAGARHSFTNPGADDIGIEGIKYDKNADVRSWRHMKGLFAEIFAE